MALPVYRLRRWLAATAIGLSLVVAGMYFYARSRARDVLKEVPNKIPYEIKQTANGFQFSKSDGKRTLFTIQASDVKEFKLNGRAELHNVSIVLYGRDSSRYDQIYGDDFAYDPETGDVTAKGDVQIDLVANPTGMAYADQAAPKELKNPIHLKTRDLVFNKETGNASTEARVEFRTPQASGWAVGVHYAGKSNVLTLASKVHLELIGASPAVIEAERGVITGEPRQVVLDHPHLDSKRGSLQADSAVFRLGPDNNVESIFASGNVNAETQTAAKWGSPAAGPVTETHGHADQAEFFLSGKQNLLRSAVLTGHVHVEQSGDEPVVGDAGRVTLDFSGQNQLDKVRALDSARLVQTGTAAQNSQAGSGPQQFMLTAPEIDFTMWPGNILQRAVTQGNPQITISPAPSTAAKSEASVGYANGVPHTVVTADSFEGIFNNRGTKNRLSGIYGMGNARVVNSNPGFPDRVSTSDKVGVVFKPDGGVLTVGQGGHVTYTDNQPAEKRLQAWAGMANYTPDDQMLVLTGNNMDGPPQVFGASVMTTATTVRINRATDEAFAEGDVKSTYSDLKEQPDGALLASSSPIHVTAQHMTVHGNPAVATYSGKARLWQDTNVIEAPTIEFDRNRRFVTAQGTTGEPARTTLIQREKVPVKTAGPEKGAGDGKAKSKTPPGGASPVAITASRLIYTDSERKVHYDGGVVASGVDFTASAKTMDVYLLSRAQAASQRLANQPLTSPGQLERIEAQGDVVIQQPKRRAKGQQLVYTAAEDKFVLTGGPPSIFDAEQGKITGVSLTFYKRDDRVLVEGGASTPVVTQTRVAR